MADLSDVTAYLAQVAANAVYPNGTSQASIAPVPPSTQTQTFTKPADVRIYEGWPIPASLDADIAGQNRDGSLRTNGPAAQVSIFPMMGTGIQVYQILDETYTIVPPAYGLTVSVAGTVITLSGQPVSGEYLTLVTDRAHIFSTGGATTAALLSALLTQVQVNYPSATADATTITVPYQFELDVRQGSVATLGKVTHRQRQAVMVSVWAPTPAARTAIAAAIDNLIKQSNKVSMPDTSQAVVCYSRTNVIDEIEKATIYRRDLIYDVEYATVEQFPGYVITSVKTSIADPTNTAIATAIT